MRKANQEIRDKRILEEILSGSSVCRVSMNDGEAPYLLPFNYGYKNGFIYIHCSPHGKKIDLLKRNNRVCFEITSHADIIENELACKWATKYRSVIGYGRIDLLSDTPEKQNALEIIMAHNGYREEMNFDEKQVESVFIIKLTIDSVNGKQSGNWDKLVSEAECNIETDRLFLKEITWSDLNDIHNLHSHPEVDEFNTLGIPEGLDDTRKIIAPLIKGKHTTPRRIYTWKLTHKETNMFIGLAGMTLSNDKFRLGEIYYKFLPEYWGKGLATEVAKRLIVLGFEKFKLHKVEAGVATENISSIRVLEKSGMKCEGIRRKILPVRGNWLDNYHYAIVEDDKRDY